MPRFLFQLLSIPSGFGRPRKIKRDELTAIARNVPFHQTVDLARRLEARDVPYDELALTNEIHGFLRHDDGWTRADKVTAEFFARQFGYKQTDATRH